MSDHIDAVISLCDKIETLELTEAEQTVLRALVDIALDCAALERASNDVTGFAASADPIGLRESIGHVTLALPETLSRRLAFDRRRPAGSGYQAMPELDANTS